METGVIIARFQTPYLHEGHMELIQEVRQQHDKLIIVLGINPIGSSRRNPYDFYTRERMIKSNYPDVVILPLSDHPSDTDWSRNLDALLESAFPTEKFTLYGSRDSFIPYYSGKNITTELPEHGDYSATELRKKFADKVFDSKDFRAGILYALHNQYKKVYTTVDVAVFRENKSEVLLGKKANSNRLRFVGGFSDPEDESYEMAAQREMKEECGEIEVSPMVYEASTKVHDWRYRNEVDKIITILYSCDWESGEVQPQDDIVHLDWVKVSDLPRLQQQNQLAKEHDVLFDHIIGKYLK
jgi:bifunctional NMN adenylyltransferase/nudix hydrolase